jgi:hypothetical protein
MNYKIKITADNQAIVKRIADENGMNKYNYLFKNCGQFYIIVNNEFDNIFVQNATELTTEQFIELFDKKETEWQPKRGDRVLVWDDDETPVERIFLTEIEGKINPIVVVDGYCEEKFLNNKNFNCSRYHHMKPLPIEQPKKDKVAEVAYQYCKKLGINNTSYSVDIIQSFINGAKWQTEQPKETDFKSKFEAAIDLIEEKYKDYSGSIRINVNDLEFQKAAEYKLLSNELSSILNQIKQI